MSSCHLRTAERSCLYKKSRMLPPGIEFPLTHIPPESQNKHTTPHPLTKTNYYHPQWLSATLPHTIARATSALSPRTSSRATPPTPHHAALLTSLAAATIGHAGFWGTLSTSTTSSLLSQLRDPVPPSRRQEHRSAQTETWSQTPASHSCFPLQHTA